MPHKIIQASNMLTTPEVIPIAGPIPPAPLGFTWDELMDMAHYEASLAQSMGEIPVGAIIISMQGKILAKEHNKCISLHDPTAHAEILALRTAGVALNNYRLNNTILIVTLEPCLMCAGALVHARIDGLVYGAADRRAGAISSCCEGLNYGFLNHKIWHMGGVRSEKCAAILKDFFNKKI